MQDTIEQSSAIKKPGLWATDMAPACHICPGAAAGAASTQPMLLK